MEMPFPEPLVGYLELYLQEFRPALLIGRPKPGVVRPETAALWIGKGSRIMGGAAITFQIRRHTAAAFGKSINPHLFRDICATSVAIEDPEHVRMGRCPPGHTTLTISEKHYNQSRIVDSSRRNSAAMSQARQEVAELVR